MCISLHRAHTNGLCLPTFICIEVVAFAMMAAGVFVLAVGVGGDDTIEFWVGLTLLILAFPAWGAIILPPMVLLVMAIALCLSWLWADCVGISACVTESWSEAHREQERPILVQTPGTLGRESA